MHLKNDWVFLLFYFVIYSYSLETVVIFNFKKIEYKKYFYILVEVSLKCLIYALSVDIALPLARPLAQKRIDKNNQ